MGSLSDYAELEILDHVLKTGIYTAATTLYVGLSTGTVADATTGSDVVEPSTASAYARVECNTWDAAATRATENTGVITFVQATGDWGTITDWFIADHVTTGNIIAYGTFSTGKAVGTGDNPSIAAGGIDISVTTASEMSDDIANKILDHLFKTAVYTAATNLYVGLSTGTIANATTGSAAGEPSGGAYARVACNTWDVATAGAVANTAAITFVQATASWGTITDFFIADHLTTGNLLFYTVADASKAVGTNDTIQLDAGSFDITLT